MNQKNHLFFLLFMLICINATGQVVDTKYPKREFRGAWIQAVNGQFKGMAPDQMKQTLVGQLNSLQEAGINAIIFQVRPEADALYASGYEPWSRFLTGTQGKAPSPLWDPMLFMINGLLIINGPIRVSPGVVFRISGVAKFGEHIEIGGGCKILANNYIEIGEFTRFAFGSIVCDTNYHYVVNNNIVQRKEGKVLIGASVWIGNSCSIVKGAIIPNGSIVSNKSFVNKDFSDYHKMILLAGSPAKVIKEHCTHIRSSKLEKEIDEFFKDNNDMSICDFNMTYFDDEN